MSTKTYTKKNNTRHAYQTKLTVQRYLESNIAKYNNPGIRYSDICSDVYNTLNIKMSEDTVRSLFKMACLGFGVKVNTKLPRKRKYKAYTLNNSTAFNQVGTVHSQISDLIKQMQMLINETTPINSSFPATSTNTSITK